MSSQRGRRAVSLTTATAGAMLATLASAAPPAKPAPRAPARPAAPAVQLAPLPMLPSVARVKIDVLKAQVVVIQEINLPRGDWKSDPLDFYVAFGAPGAPRAIDAQLLAIADGALDSEDADVGEPLAVDRAPHRPASSHPLIGRDSMAGVVVHVKRESLAHAFAPGNMAQLRIRTALDVPEEDSTAAHGVVVRLGASRGTPLTLGRITLSAKSGAPAFARAEAHLCGAEADTSQLAIAVVPKPPPPSTTSPPSPPIAPVLAVRHPTDDLCVRYWL